MLPLRMCTKQADSTVMKIIEEVFMQEDMSLVVARAYSEGRENAQERNFGVSCAQIASFHSLSTHAEEWHVR